MILDHFFDVTVGRYALISESAVSQKHRKIDFMDVLGLCLGWGEMGSERIGSILNILKSYG